MSSKPEHLFIELVNVHCGISYSEWDMVESTRFANVLQYLLLVFSSIEPKEQRAYLE